MVWRKGLANTLKQSRQFIVHGHIAIAGTKIDKPSYIVQADEEGKINWYGNEIMFEQKKHSVKKGPKTDEKVNELKKQFEEAKPIEALHIQVIAAGLNDGAAFYGEACDIWVATHPDKII